MSDEGQRIEFGDSGPYLFDLLDGEPEAMLLEEHDVCLLQFDRLYLPVSLDVCKLMADCLSNVSQVSMGPERKGMLPMDFDLEEEMELPLLTEVAAESFQYGEIVYLDVKFDDTDARLCLSGRTAAMVGEILSQIPTK